MNQFILLLVMEKDGVGYSSLAVEVGNNHSNVGTRHYAHDVIV